MRRYVLVFASNSESVLVIPELLPCSRMLVAMADKSRSGGWRLAWFDQTIKPKFGLAPSSRARRVYNLQQPTFHNPLVVQTLYPLVSEQYSLKMSSPPRQRTGRSSASATPRRATRNPAAPSSSAPNDQLQSEASQATFPSSSRLLDSSQSQSPLFMQSSPVRYSGEDAAESDGGATPRAVQVNISMSVGGILSFGN
jgi:hypothetical protein